MKFVLLLKFIFLLNVILSVKFNKKDDFTDLSHFAESLNYNLNENSKSPFSYEMGMQEPNLFDANFNNLLDILKQTNSDQQFSITKEKKQNFQIIKSKLNNEKKELNQISSKNLLKNHKETKIQDEIHLKQEKLLNKLPIIQKNSLMKIKSAKNLKKDEKLKQDLVFDDDLSDFPI